MASVTSDALPFDLSNREPPIGSHDLFFIFGRKPTAPLVSGCHTSTASAATKVSGLYRHLAMPADVSGYQSARWASGSISRCHRVTVGYMPSLAACVKPVSSPSVFTAQYTQVQTSYLPAISRCVSPRMSPTLFISDKTLVRMSAAPLLKSCVNTNYNNTDFIANATEYTTTSVMVNSCHDFKAPKAVIPDCYFYEIPADPYPKPKLPCGIPPPSNQLDFDLKHRELAHDSDRLPFSLRCGQPVTEGINKRTYMIYNTITATANGQAIGLLSASISTSMDTFCWQVSAKLPPLDYKRLDFSQEIILQIVINGSRWDFLLDDIADREQFANEEHTVTGCSITQKLSAVHALRKSKIYTTALNARQIIDDVLNLLPFSLTNYNTVDWLIPANTYSVAAHAPIDTINDIARAARAFVASHPYLPQIDVLPQYPVAAWDLKTVTPDHVAPSSSVLSMSGDLQVNEKCNAVYVTGSADNAHGGHVYRSAFGGNRVPEAPAVSHALYTDAAVIRKVGIAALSDTGTHKLYQAEMLWSDTHNMPLGELGKIWQISTAADSVTGIIQSLSINLTHDNDAPVITQTLALDSYEDD